MKRYFNLALVLIGLSAIWLAIPTETSAQDRAAVQRQHDQELVEYSAKVMDGCRSGYWLDCSRIDEDELFPAGSPEILEAGLKGCALKNRYGCYSAGGYYEKYSSDPNHLNLAVKYYKIACDEGVPKACMALTNQALGAQGAAAATDVVQDNGKLCNSGDALACNWLGLSLFNGRLVAQDRAKSLQFFNRGCKLGNKAACDNAAMNEAEAGYAAIGEKDYVSAMRHFNAACTGGNANGCLNLGVMYDRGEGVAQNHRQAVALYDKACTGGDAQGCTNLGIIGRSDSGNSGSNRGQDEAARANMWMQNNRNQGLNDNGTQR